MKVVWLYPKFYWDRKLDPVRRQTILAIQRHPDVELKVSGVGWPEYNRWRTVEWNVNRLMPDCHLAVWFKPLGVLRDLVPPLRRCSELRATSAVRFHEAYWPRERAIKEVRRVGSKIVICQYPQEMRRFGDPDLHVLHIPGSADPGIFRNFSGPFEQRDVEVLLTGTVNSLYPLRPRFRSLIETGRLPGEVRPRGPYNTRSAAESERLYEDYASHLGRAKIAIMDASIYGFALSKYFEAAAAGCLVMGVMPEEAPAGFADFVVPIEGGASDDEIVDLVNRWLSRPEDLRRRAELGRRIILENYSHEHYAERFVDGVGQALRSMGVL